MKIENYNQNSGFFIFYDAVHSNTTRAAVNSLEMLFHVYLLSFTSNSPGVFATEKVDVSLIWPKHIVPVKAQVNSTLLHLFVFFFPFPGNPSKPRVGMSEASHATSLTLRFKEILWRRAFHVLILINQSQKKEKKSVRPFHYNFSCFLTSSGPVGVCNACKGCLPDRTSRSRWCVDYRRS